MIHDRLKIAGAAAIFLVATSGLFSADASPVANPAKRQEILARGKKILSARTGSPVEADPFHSEKFSEMVYGPKAPVSVAAPMAPKNDRDILQAIAASLKPSGNFNVGGQQTLVFGQKRVKAGSMLTITFEGTEYTLEITAIERTSFTLRLNREEFTRPIK